MHLDFELAIPDEILTALEYDQINSVVKYLQQLCGYDVPESFPHHSLLSPPTNAPASFLANLPDINDLTQRVFYIRQHQVNAGPINRTGDFHNRLIALQYTCLNEALPPPFHYANIRHFFTRLFARADPDTATHIHSLLRQEDLGIYCLDENTRALHMRGNFRVNHEGFHYPIGPYSAIDYIPHDIGQMFCLRYHTGPDQFYVDNFPWYSKAIPNEPYPSSFNSDTPLSELSLFTPGSLSPRSFVFAIAQSYLYHGVPLGGDALSDGDIDSDGSFSHIASWNFNGKLSAMHRDFLPDVIPPQVLSNPKFYDKDGYLLESGYDEIEFHFDDLIRRIRDFIEEPHTGPNYPRHIYDIITSHQFAGLSWHEIPTLFCVNCFSRVPLPLIPYHVIHDRRSLHVCRPCQESWDKKHDLFAENNRLHHRSQVKQCRQCQRYLDTYHFPSTRQSHFPSFSSSFESDSPCSFCIELNQDRSWDPSSDARDQYRPITDTVPPAASVAAQPAHHFQASWTSTALPRTTDSTTHSDSWGTPVPANHLSSSVAPRSHPQSSDDELFSNTSDDDEEKKPAAKKSK